MHLEIRLTKLAPETVDSAVVDKLYDLYHNRQSGDTFDLLGYIKTGAIFRDVETELETAFQDLEIEPSEYYIVFEDPEVVRVLTEKGIIPEGGSITTTQAANITSGSGLFSNNETVEHFDEFKYFTKLNQSVDLGTLVGVTYDRTSSLISIDLTNLTRLFGGLCQYCRNLTYFHGMDNLQYTLNLVNLTNPYHNGAQAAFQECLGLKHVVSLGNATYLAGRTFITCTNLEDVMLPSQCVNLLGSCFQDCNKLSVINLSQLTTIGNSAFEGCSSLEYCDGPNSTRGELNLPNLTGTLGNNAFKGCTKLTSISSLGSITSIGSSAFENCGNLATINFPNTITSVGERAFNNTAWYNSQPSGPVYIAKALYKCKNASGVLVIPNNIVSITKEAFFDCSSLTSVTIGSDVASIDAGVGMFKGCTALNTVVVDSNNSIYDSRDNCNAIITTATNILIAGCKNTVIPNGVTSIGNYSFWCCTGLTSANIPNGVTSIGRFAFAGCTGLTSVSIPNSVISIYDTAFSNCSSLTSVTIPNSVTSIKERAFSACQGLTSITIEATVPPTLSADVFQNTNNNFLIYVPAGSVSAYQSASRWSDYASRIHAIPTT